MPVTLWWKRAWRFMPWGGRRLVTAGSLTALEFWASKRREVRAAAAALKGPQSTGISTSLLDFMNRPQDPKTGRVNVTITPEVEKQIFAETPGLRHTYAVSVPHRRTRAEFFSEFFKMLQNRIERRRKKAAGAAPWRLPICKNELIHDLW